MLQMSRRLWFAPGRCLVFIASCDRRIRQRRSVQRQLPASEYRRLTSPVEQATRFIRFTFALKLQFAQHLPVRF